MIGARDPSANFMARGVVDWQLMRQRTKRLATFTDPEKVGKLMRDMREYKGHFVAMRVAIDAAALSEVRAASTHAMVSARSRSRHDLALPSEIMKGTKENLDSGKTRAHWVPLPNQAVSVLRTQKSYRAPGMGISKHITSPNARLYER